MCSNCSLNVFDLWQQLLHLLLTQLKVDHISCLSGKANTHRHTQGNWWKKCEREDIRTVLVHCMVTCSLQTQITGEHPVMQEAIGHIRSLLPPVHIEIPTTISRLTIEYIWGGPYRLATWTKLQFCNCTCVIEPRHMSSLAASINPPTEGLHLIVPSCFRHHLLVDLQEKHYMTQNTLFCALCSSFYGHSSSMQYDHTTPLLHWLLVTAVTLLFCCFQNLLMVAASLLSRAPCVAVMYAIGSTYVHTHVCVWVRITYTWLYDECNDLCVLSCISIARLMLGLLLNTSRNYHAL